jgi:hypothetical protein
LSPKPSDSAESNDPALDTPLSRPAPERRGTPRYPVDTQIFACIDGQTVRLGNISEQGVAIYGSGLSAGSAHLLEMNINRRHVTVSVQILDCSGGGMLHARFLAPPTDAQHVIRAYIADIADTV